jgi:A/G-specific adenine glycosylase
VRDISNPLLAWYARARRALPWRRKRDPYRIWVSEIMLQQTLVAAVVPYYRRFLERFPDVAALARARPAEVLACWSGLGYYARARNLHRAARLIRQAGAFPEDYAGWRRLPGVGEYTAAAIASIAFNQPHAVLDGNVVRVLARLYGESGDAAATATRKRLRELAEGLLDPRRPGDFNQALMELGATVCLPRSPRCAACPLQVSCRAHQEGREDELPVRSRATPPTRVERTLLIIERRGALLLWQREDKASRLAGFWELPRADQLPAAALEESLGHFDHAIANHRYVFTVAVARLALAPAGFHWIPRSRLAHIPLSTASRKALALCGDQEEDKDQATSAADAGRGRRRSRRGPSSCRRRKAGRQSAPPAGGPR